MIPHLIDELIDQSPDITNQYIADVENVFKRSSVTEFQEAILLAALALFKKTSREFENPRIIKALIKYTRERLGAESSSLLHSHPSLFSELIGFKPIQLLSYILFAEPYTKKESSFSSCSSINRLLAELLKNEDDILDWGFDYGQLLVYTALYGYAYTLWGIEIDVEHYRVTALRLKLLKDRVKSKIICEDIFNNRQKFENKRELFNRESSPVEVIHPPLGTIPLTDQENNRFILPSFTDSFDISLGFAAYKSEWPFILTALEHLESDQRVFAITTNGAASTETYNDIRRDLVKHGLVECVVQLSENLLPGTSIPSMLWIFSKNNETVRLIDASNIRTEGRRKFTLSLGNIEEIAHLINNRRPVAELSEKYQSLISYLSPSELAESNYNLSPSHHLGEDFPADYILLNEVCKINRGVLLKAQELDALVADNNSVKYITPKNLHNNVIDLKRVTSLAGTDEVLVKKSIGSDDIIMSKLLPFKAGYITDTKNNLVFSNGNTYYLQINKKAINPLFLFMYLNSKTAQKQLEQLSRGSSTSTLSISDLKNFKIPKVKRSVQDALAEKYKASLKEEQQLHKKINKLEKAREQLIEEIL